ncbi:uncharacterized protein HaLaN_15871 [Haematococcus lacustris]|uniref:Uncharacterized protein n=1 Tax=Haematococcus lacustris TaxID=44745 RepID=A0A699ZIS3_HAELA|nr:uncharacterized protein HaLaN_15871 [Haematococcus lacustris]
MNALTYFGIESGVALVAATFINIFVVGVFAAGFFKPDGPPPDIGLQNAGEVIGSAIAVALLSQGAVPLWAGALLSAGVSFLLLLVVEKAGVRQLELLFAGLIGIMIATFGYMFASADVPMAEVAKGLVVPRLPRAYVPTAVALFGSLIMPHNIYLHSALVQTRGLQGASQRTKMNALTYFGIESGVALVAATFINIFVVGVFAAGFFKPDGPPPDIGLQNAGVFLGATYGSVVVTVWGVGLLAAGQSSTMTGTYTGQFVMSGWLDWKVSAWQRIIVTRSVALVPTMAVALMMDPDSTQLDRLNQGLNLLQSIQLPFALVPLLSITGCQRLMGGLAMSGPGLAAAWAVAALVVCINMSAVAEVATVWVC